MWGLEIVVEYVSAFADFVLTGKNESLLGRSHFEETHMSELQCIVITRYVSQQRQNMTTDLV